MDGEHLSQERKHFRLATILFMWWPGPEVIKLFLCSTQLSMELQILIKSKMLKNKDVSCLQMLRCCIYHAHKY